MNCVDFRPASSYSQKNSRHRSQSKCHLNGALKGFDHESHNVAAECPERVKSLPRMKLYRLVLLVMMCALAGLAAPSLQGQATGSFAGTVLDRAGAAVPGASVVATSEGTGLTRDVKTDGTGHYSIPLLPVGNYSVRVNAASFQSAVSNGLRLQVDEARELNFSLSAESQSAVVNVSDNPVAIETANPSLGQVITSEQVAQLPLNGRDFVQLATLTSGATAETNPNSFFTQGSDSEVAARGSFSLSVGAQDRMPRIGCWMAWTTTS